MSPAKSRCHRDAHSRDAVRAFAPWIAALALLLGPSAQVFAEAPAGAESRPSAAPEATLEAPLQALPDLALPGGTEDALEPAPTADAAAELAAESPPQEADGGSGRNDTPPPTSQVRTPLKVVGETIRPGTLKRLSWSPPDTFEGLAAPTPVLVANGDRPGPVLCLTGAVHGDEINGVEIIRRVFNDLDLDSLAGAVIGVPIVNQVGFRRASRYLPDRRDLNRFFPGSRNGSSAARIAYSLFQEVIVHCDLLVDIHTGSFQRTNLPQLRADLAMPSVRDFAGEFGGMVVVNSVGTAGTLRREAARRGIPAVTLEVGEAQRVQVAEVQDGAARIKTLMHNLAMQSALFRWPQREPNYLQSRWVRAEQGGLFIASVELGHRIGRGDRIGTVVDPITNAEYIVRAPSSGRVLGMALNQVVRPGYALVHLGIDEATAEGLDLDAEARGGDGLEAEMD